MLSYAAGRAGASGGNGAGFDIQSVAGGRWSEAATWQPRRLPGEGDRVLIQPGHEVVYDVATKDVIRSIAIGGTRKRGAHGSLPSGSAVTPSPSTTSTSTSARCVLATFCATGPVFGALP